MIYTTAYLTALAHQLAWFVAVVVVIGLAERRWPAGPAPDARDRSRNFLLVVLVSLTLAAVHSLVAVVPESVLIRGLFGNLTGGWHPTAPWSIALAALAFALVWDCFQYWSHRLQHVVPWLWPAHALHHDDDRLNATTTLRNNIWSGAIQLLFVYLPTAVICGVDLLTVYGAYLLFATWGFVNHANVRVSFGRLTPVISGPQLHRVHHARSPAYHDCNYAAFFPVYDVVFGTYRRPGPGEFPATGLADRAPAPLAPAQLVRDVLGLPPAPGAAPAPAPAGD